MPSKVNQRFEIEQQVGRWLRDRGLVEEAESIESGEYAAHDETLGDRLQRMRKRLGMGVSELATAVGVTRLQVYRWESDISCPTPRHMKSLAKLLGTTPGRLLPT
jgi:DNA-binding transcriptional regulator YiaG